MYLRRKVDAFLEEWKADKNRKIYNGMLKTYFYSFIGPKPPKKRD